MLGKKKTHKRSKLADSHISDAISEIELQQKFEDLLILKLPLTCLTVCL